MGVLSGIIAGLVATGLYRRYNDIHLPDYLAFFGGKRFVPIITALAALILGAIFGFIWPPVEAGVDALGRTIVGLGAIGTGIYGFLNRLLIPVGLHHVINTYIWLQLGTYNPPGGEVVHGEITRYFAGDPEAGSFLAGFFPIMMFGLPAACLAMIRHARQTKVAAGILLSAALASFLTGITEPIEFAFIFVAPVLFIVHAVLTGTALAVTTLLGIQIGFGFSAGFIDYALNFTKSNTDRPVLLLGVGLVYAVIYYVVFSFLLPASTWRPLDGRQKVKRQVPGIGSCPRASARPKRRRRLRRKPRKPERKTWPTMKEKPTVTRTTCWRRTCWRHSAVSRTSIAWRGA